MPHSKYEEELHYDGHRPCRVTDDDIPDEDLEDLSEEIINHLQKDVRREKRMSRTMRSRDRNERDYCGSTFHVSRRNDGRKPRKKWKE